MGEQSSSRDPDSDSDEDKETEMTLKKLHVTLGDLESFVVEICCRNITHPNSVL